MVGHMLEKGQSNAYSNHPLVWVSLLLHQAQQSNQRAQN